jgi:serine/threonine-protein kinase HipA
MTTLPEKVKRLDVTIGTSGGAPAGELLKESNYQFQYRRDDTRQPAVGLLMPPDRMIYQDADLFPSMDMNLPEGFLFQRIIERYPKRQLTKMDLLALMGTNAIGRVGYFIPGSQPQAPATIPRNELLGAAASDSLFDELVRCFLSTGAGISGVQPKVMVLTRALMPTPDVIVKTAGSDYPGLAANEFMCLRAARLANMDVPPFELSIDGKLLVIDRFDLEPDGARVGFEDIAALMGARVNDRLSSRKYLGSYEAVAQAVATVSSNRARDLQALFAQIALSIMVRNGDAHLKNFGMLYSGPGENDVRLSPLFDVVTTAIYKYERPGGVLDVDRTMALKLRRGKHGSRAYPTTADLIAFGKEVCAVDRPVEVLQRIGHGMSQALAECQRDSRIPLTLVNDIGDQWVSGLAIELEASAGMRRGARSRVSP